MSLRIKHWQDVVSVVVGLWLMASPWVLGIQKPLAAEGSFVILGAVLIGFVVTEFFIRESWEEWSELAIGLWLIASPWILEFTDVRAAMQNAIACGVVLSVLALWVLGTDDALGGWLHRFRRAH